MDFANLATGAVKGATAGAALGPIGAAVGALLGAAPEALGALGIHLFDEPTAAAAMDVVKQVTGKGDPTAADVAGLSPDQRAALAVQLAQVAAQRAAEQNRAAEAARQADLDGLRASLADVADARRQTVALAAAGSRTAWGAPVTSMLVLAAFITLGWAVMFHQVPAGSEQLAVGLLEAAKLLAVTVVAYWCGSSAGSQAKDATIHAAVVGR